MTFERRCTVEMSDVPAVVFECSGCGSSTRIPVSMIESARIELLATECPYCRAPSGFGINTQEFRNLRMFCLSLKDFAGSTEGRNLRVNLELRCSDLEAKK